MASPSFERPPLGPTKDGVSPTSASRHHSLTRSPYHTPKLPPLTPPLLPTEEQPCHRPTVGPRSCSSAASRSKSWTASKSRQQKQPAEEKASRELEIEGPFPPPMPVSTLLRQQDHVDRQDPQPQPRVSNPSYISEGKQEKKVLRSLSDRVKAALNDMFKKPDQDDEGEEIKARHWTDEDY